MIEKYLRKLQELQCKTLGTPVRFWLHTHFDDDAKEPFLCITVMGPEWGKESENESGDSQYLSVHLYQWNESSEEENEAAQAKVYASIEAFVNNLLSK